MTGMLGDIQTQESRSMITGFLHRAVQGLSQSDGLFRAVLEALPAAIYITDPAGKITFYNEAAAQLWGHRPELGKAEWCGSWKIFLPDGTPLPHDQCPMALVLKGGGTVSGFQAEAERPDGSRVPFMPFPTLLHDASGTLVGAVNMLIDLSDHRQAERDHALLAAIVQSSDDAVVSKTLDGTINSWNSGAERLFGYTAAEAIGRPITMLIPDDRSDEEPEILARVRNGQRIEHYDTVRQRKDGSLVEISLTVSPIKDASGKVIGASKIARDITERRNRERRQSLLLSEMNHRIRNTLATVQAISGQTMRGAPPEERAAFGARLQTLARAHDLLTLEHWNQTSVREVAERSLEAFREQHSDRLIIDGPEAPPLEPGKAMMLAMTFHELATNAVKYGALSDAGGSVLITWMFSKTPRPGRIQLLWQERDGPPVTSPQRQGFGTRLIELSGGRLDFDPTGLSCAMEIAL